MKKDNVTYSIDPYVIRSFLSAWNLYAEGKKLHRVVLNVADLSIPVIQIARGTAKY